MTILHIDFETRSTVDLRRTGVYRYAEDPTTDVWCAAYAVDDAFVDLWVPGYVRPPLIVDAVARGDIFVAHNANFERTIWSRILTPRYGWPECPPPERWQCTMAQALAMSLPASLQNAAAAVGLDQGKDMSGRRLMLQLAQPRRPRKGEDPDGLYWWDDEERLAKLYAYCKQDVEVERALHKRLVGLTSTESRTWALDQRINDRGVYVDMDLCNAALKVVQTATQWLDAEIAEITHGEVSAPTNVGQISSWLRLQGFPTESLDKEAVGQMLLREDLPERVRRVLEIRREAAKAAVKKIDALIAGKSADGRARGLTQYHAASTGRWAGRRFQPHNIKRPELRDVDGAIECTMAGDAGMVSVLYGEPLSVVGDCLRGMVRAAPGSRILAADFANIEGRVLAWLAGEHWKLKAFSDYDHGRGHDIYHLTAGKVLGKDPSAITKDERQVSGKVPELALGFQGGVGAFQSMAHNYGVKIPDERAEEIKVAWREEHPQTCQLWYELESAAKNAVRNPGKVFYVEYVAFRVSGSFLWMRLPGGRSLCYPYPCIKPKETPWGEKRDSVSYKGVDSYSRKWGDCYAYGGLWAENATQAVARDVMRDAMFRLEAAGYPVILTVHDEIVSEVPIGVGSVSEFERLVTTIPEWADGLPVAAKAWEADRYRKD
jgi:DNA polymerase